MKPVTRVFSSAHAALYRVTGGRAQVKKYPTMLLTVTGRKTGKKRTVPVVYVTDGDRFVIAAAYSGSNTDPTWWRNLQANPAAAVHVLGRTVEVQASLARPAERPTLWKQLVAMYPYSTNYQQRTNREIPVVILTPVSKYTAPAPTSQM